MLDPRRNSECCNFTRRQDQQRNKEIDTLPSYPPLGRWVRQASSDQLRRLLARSDPDVPHLDFALSPIPAGSMFYILN